MSEWNYGLPENRVSKEEANKIVSNNVEKIDSLFREVNFLLKEACLQANEHKLSFSLETPNFINLAFHDGLDYDGDGIESDGKSAYGSWSSSSMNC